MNGTFMTVVLAGNCTYLLSMVFAVLMFLPEHHLRPHFGIRCAIMGMAAILLTLLSAVLLEYFYIKAWFYQVTSLLYCLIGVGWMLLCFKLSWARYLNVWICTMLCCQAYSSLARMTATFLDSSETTLLSLLPKLYVFPLYLLIDFFLGRKIRKDQSYNPDMKYTVTLALLVACSLPVGLLEEPLRWQGEDLFAYACLCVGESVFCIILLFFQYWLYKDNLRQAEEALEKSMAEKRLEYFENMCQVVDTMNLRMHDLKHQIHRVGQVETVEPEALKDIERTISDYQAMVYTDYPDLDVILTEKSMRCERLEIDFDCNLDGESLSMISTKDMNGLFGNALDNAIEYLQNVKDRENRFIKIYGHDMGGFVKVGIENYCADEIVFGKEGLPVTTKGDGMSHGYGMKSICNIVETYGGHTVIRVEDKLFKLHILFPKRACLPRQTSP